MAQFYTFANDIGGSGAQLQNLYQNRELGDQRLLAQQIQANRDRQAQQNFMLQFADRSKTGDEELALRKAALAASIAERAGTLDYQNRGLKLSEDYQKWLMAQPKTNPSDIRDLEIRKDRAIKMASAGLPPDTTGLHPADVADINVTFEAAKNDILQRHKLSQDAADILNAPRRIIKQINDNRAVLGLPYDPTGTAQDASPRMLGGLFGTAEGNTARDNIKALQDTLAKHPPADAFDKNKVDIRFDPKAGIYVPATPVYPWMVNPAATGGRQLNMVAPSGDFGGELGPPQPVPMPATGNAMLSPPVQVQLSPEDQALGSLTRQTITTRRPLNIVMPQTATTPSPVITAPPPMMTGTNRPPPFVRQNGVVFRLMPDGSYQPAQ